MSSQSLELPSIQLDKNLILQARLPDNSLRKRLGYAYLSKLHISEAFEVTKAWGDARDYDSVGATEIADDLFSIAHVMKGLGVAPELPLLGLISIKKIAEENHNSYANDNIALNIIKTQLLLGIERKPEEITNLLSDKENALDCLLYFAEEKGIKDEHSVDYINTARKVISTFDTSLYWTKMEYYTRLGRFLTLAGFDGSKEFNQADLLAGKHPEDHINNPGFYAQLAGIYTASGLVDRALNLLVVNKRADEITTGKTLARRDSRQEITKVIAEAYMEQENFDGAIDLVSTQMVFGKYNPFMAEVLSRKAVHEAKDGANPVPTIEELQSVLQRVSLEDLSTHIASRLRIGETYFLLGNTQGLRDQFLDGWQQMQRQFLKRNDEGYVSYSCIAFIKTAHEIGYATSPLSQKVAARLTNNPHFIEDVAKKAIELCDLEAAWEIIKRHNLYEKHYSNAPTILLYLAEAEGKAGVSSSEISSLTEEEIRKIITGGDKLSLQAVGCLNLDSKVDPKTISDEALFPEIETVIYYGKTVGATLIPEGNQTPISQDKKYLAIKEITTSLKKILNTLYFSEDYELVRGVAEIGYEKADCLLRHSIFPSSAVAYYIKNHGNAGLKEILDLKKATEQGKFDFDNNLQRELEYLKFLQLALQESPAFANRDYFEALTYSEPQFFMSSREIMQTEACAFEAAKGFWYIKSLVDAGKTVDVVANERNGANLFGEPLRSYLNEIGVNLSRYHIHGSSSSGNIKLPGFKKYLKERKPDYIIVVDTTPNTTEEQPRMPGALERYHHWFDNLGKKEAGQKRKTAFWVPDPREKIEIGKHILDYREADVTSSDRYLILMNPVTVNPELFHGCIGNTENYKPSYFDDPDEKAEEVAFGFTAYGVQLLSSGRNEEILVRDAQKQIESSLPKMLKLTHPQVGRFK